VTIFWNLPPCILVHRDKVSRQICCLYLESNPLFCPDDETSRFLRNFATCLTLHHEDEGSSETLVGLSTNTLLPWRWRQQVSPKVCTYLHASSLKMEGTGSFEIVVPIYNRYSLYTEEITFSETWVSIYGSSFSSKHGSNRIPWKVGTCLQDCWDPIPVGNSTHGRRHEDLRHNIQWQVYSSNSDWEHLIFLEIVFMNIK
jgi:hypothetical protein